MKIINKIIGAVLGVTMAAGIGIGVWGGHKDFTPVKAAGTDTTEYSLVSSATDLEAGKSYIITSGTSGTVKAMAITNNTNNRKSVDVTISDNKIVRGSSVLSLTLGGESGTWTFHTENYGGTAGYFTQGNQTSKNYLKIGSSGDNFTISFSGTAAVITSTKQTTRNIIRYNTNNGDPIFSCYTSGQSDVFLWKEGYTTPVEPEHGMSIDDPYTVAEARTIIDTETSKNGVYVKGVVSKIIQAWNTQYNNISFFISDSGNKTEDLEAYRCVGTDTADASNIEVGDIVIVHGNLIKYNDTTYELNSGCELVSLDKELSTWCASFLSTITCDATGATPPSTTNWTTMKTSFTALSSESKAILLEVNNDATARYDYIVAKYGTNTYEDFIGRNPAPLASNRLLQNEQVYIPTIATVAVLGIVASLCVAYFIFKKKKLA